MNKPRWREKYEQTIPKDKKLEFLKEHKRLSDERYERLILTRPINNLWRHLVAQEMLMNNNVTQELLTYQHEIVERKLVLSIK